MPATRVDYDRRALVGAEAQHLGGGLAQQPPVKPLNLADWLCIDRALQRLGDCGEVHLVVERGRLRYVETLMTKPLGRDGGTL